MSGRYVLDTNIVIALFDREKSVRDRLGEAEDIFIPIPVVAELYFGAFQSTRPEQNVARIDDLAQSYTVLTIDELTAKIYGKLQQELRATGTPIPMNDVWIGASARQWGATVATRDDHFSQLAGVAVEMW